ncbi:MAG: TonB-dependent receptor [Burkholderiaceae bacterium]
MDVSEWSKRVGVLFQPSSRQSYHFSAATSFNTSGDAYSLSASNADVPPEQSINLELGAKLDSADGNFSTRLALFRTTKLHERNTDPDVDLVTLSGKRHVAGFEADIAGRLSPRWEVYGSYMWIPVANIDIGVAGSEGQGTRPSLTPKHSGTVWTTYQFTPRLRLGAGLNCRGKQTPNRNPGWEVPAFVTGDLMAEYMVLEERLTLKANLTNVTDKRYADQLYPGHYIPGAGRQLQVTASVKF